MKILQDKNFCIFAMFYILLFGCINIEYFHFNEAYLKKEIHALLNAGLNLSSASKYLAKRENISKRTIYNLHNK